MYCSKCGNEIKDGSIFCDKCGAKVDETAPQITEEKPEEVNAPVEETVAPKQEVSEERLDYILGLLDNKEEPKEVEEIPTEENESIVEPQEEQKEVSQERLDYILGLVENGEEQKAEPVVEEHIIEEAIAQEPIVQEQVLTQTAAPQVEQPVQQVNTQTQEQPQTVGKTIDSTAKEIETPKKSNFGLISLIIGISCIVLAFIIKLWVLPFAIAGIVFGAIEKSKDSKKVVGIALSITSIILGLIVAIIAGIFGLVGKAYNMFADDINTEIESQIDNNTNVLNSTFEGDGITLEYGSEWKEVEGFKEGKTMLQYSGQESYLIQLGKSALSEYESGYKVDFDTDEGKEKLYESFYSIWAHEDDEDYENYYFAKKDSFKLLTGDIYMASFEYGADEDNIRGNFIVLVSRESNSIVSFQTNAKTENVNKLYRESKSLLKTIEITKLDNFVKDDEMGEYLNTMSRWNQYKDIREAHNNGKKVKLEGEWIILSDSETAWEFKNGEFWFYKSYNDKKDNYWYGTYEYKTGKEGLKLIGIDESRMENILYQGNGTVTEDSVYGIVLHPKKIYADGEDKSETNMSGKDWHYVWIIVNHGSEGLEGQIGNVDTAVEQFYIKSRD